MIVTVTLNPTLDIAVPVDNFIRGKVLRAGRIFSYPGGKGTNTARALSKLGSDVLASGFTGKKNEKELVSLLSGHKVKTDFLTVPGSNRLCVFITEDNGIETVINSGSNIEINAKALRAMLAKLRSLSKKADVFVFSGSLPLSVPPSFYADCIKAVRQDSTVILDTSSKYLRHGIKARPHIIKQNLHELESAFNVKLNSPVGTGLKPVPTFTRFIRKISKKYGVNIIITTLAEKGSILFDNGRFQFIPPVKIKKVVSPVGSGDAYSAGLAFGIENGMPLPEACKLASACAAANLSYQGACFFNRHDVKKYGF